LAGERGPSFTDVTQIKKFNPLHIRFVDNYHVHPKKQSQMKENREDRFQSKAVSSINMPKSTMSRFLRNKRSIDSDDHPPCSSSLPVVRNIISGPIASLPVSKYMKLGKLIIPTKKVTTITLEEFSVETQSWLQPFTISITIDKEAFARGGFCEVFKGFCAEKLYGDYVVKRFLSEVTDRIIQRFNSLEEHARKSVQMHSLARHMAQKKRAVPEDFGETFRYTKLYFGRCEFDGEICDVTVEKFLEGENFIKFINNDGRKLLNIHPYHQCYDKKQNPLLIIHMQYQMGS